MENEVKVFHSDITRAEYIENDHLYELLKVTPAKPISQPNRKNTDDTWEFIPNNSKYFKNSKLSKSKVKTVKDIRALLEKDVYTYLMDDIWRQEKLLLRKIQDGSSRNEKTRAIANKMLNGDDPISRSAWQMLANINPGNNAYTKQFVLWNGQCIQVNGSRGGKYKFLYNFDSKNYRKIRSLYTPGLKKKVFKSKMGLLRNSLNVRFKPGPLRKKKFLDDSCHKYQMGHIELIKLPAPALDICPTYGNVLEPPISGFINNLRGETGVISIQLAEFAASAVGTTSINGPTQLNKDSYITFDLHYKLNQNRILMRQNMIETTRTYEETDANLTVSLASKLQTMTTTVAPYSYQTAGSEHFSVIMGEVNKVMDDILNSVEISLLEDSVYYSEDEPREIVTNDCAEVNGTTKDKPKNKFCELGKLDVTVIKLPENSHKNNTEPCSNSFCTLGCVCDSINCLFSLKQNCGIIDCMFGCKCEASKFNDIELLERDCSEILPGLMNLDNEINCHLSKEEKKFHQTVIVSGDKRILLKSQKRNAKSSEIFKNMKHDDKIHKKIIIDVTKLNCDNIEPFCMTHSLYKCFCKGKFTESFLPNASEMYPNKILNNENLKLEGGANVGDINISGSIKGGLRPRHRRTTDTVKYVSSSDEINQCSDYDNNDEFRSSCARTIGHYTRKYYDLYYKTTNQRIFEMEQNDHILKKKMMKLINGGRPQSQNLPGKHNVLNVSSHSEESNTSTDKNEELDYPATDLAAKESVSDENSNKLTDEIDDSDNIFSNMTPKISLKNWLETSYKIYKERRNQGALKNCLDAPKKGKMSLQSWDFILSRYRERKNHFFVSNYEPFRTFLAIDGNNPLFANCTNIDNIRFAELHKYPLVIRNLVTNSVDSENSFCILVGRDYCWELIGSAVKVFEHTAKTRIESKEISEPDFGFQDEAMNDENADWIGQMSLLSKYCTPLEDGIVETKKQVEEEINNSERSKWFVMTVENDFTEIQFYKKGFFVTYTGIQRSISLARISGKTVRLSSQARSDKNSTHQFGIYAIPSMSECCVFIGPYEVNEPLGIEVVKTTIDPRRERKTRGVWITTNKIDNMKVIEHPLSFMPSTPSDNAVLSLQTEDNQDNSKQIQTLNGEDENQEKAQNAKKRLSNKEITKIVKPIKIRRTNGFYHLSSKNMLQKIAPNTGSLVVNKASNLISLLKNPSKLMDCTQECGPTTSYSKPVAEIAPQVNQSEECGTNSSIAHMRPVAEIAPQIKITSVYSESDKTDVNRGSAMLILKPDEINKKILANTATNDDMASDIEKFLETSTICIAPQDEVFVISDGEEDTVTWKTVSIQCKNIPNFGSIRGRIRNDNLLSFEFPGFKYSDFYTETEAFNKINQVLARKIYIPKNIKLHWAVVKTEDKKIKMLSSKNLEEKKYLMYKLRENRNKNKVEKTETVNTFRTYSQIKPLRNTRSTPNSAQNSSMSSSTTTSKAQFIESLEETSMSLENESTLLLNEAFTRRDEIRTTLNSLKNLNQGMTNTLKHIMSMNKTTK